MVEDAASECWGLAFNVDAEDQRKIFSELDERESGGYVRLVVDIEFGDQSNATALTYFAPPDNHNYLGPAPLAQIAAQVCNSSGASGHNVDYVTELARALENLDVIDDEVVSLELAVRGFVSRVCHRR